MFTLILLFSLTSVSYDGGVALESQQVQKISSAEECQKAGNKAVAQLEHKAMYIQRDVAQKVNVRFTCIQTRS